jgi:hypothetical protein
MKAAGDAGAVMAASQVVALFSSVPDGLVSLGVGLWGVALARWVFVNRENRRMNIPQNWRETLPLTLVAMLVAGVIIHDQQVGLSLAAFIGLGVGWAAVLILDILGERITAAFRAGFAHTEGRDNLGVLDKSGNDGKVLNSDIDLTEDMIENLRRLDKLPYERGNKDE